MSVVLSSDGFHIESHIDSVPALVRVVESYRDAVIEQETVSFNPSPGED